MGTRRPRRNEYAPHCHPIRLAAEPGAHRYLGPSLARLRNGYYVQPFNLVCFVHLDDLADACRLALTCLQLRLIGVNAHDFPVPPAATGDEHYAIRLVIALEGGRDDLRNRATDAYLTSLTHLYAMAKSRLRGCGTRVVQMHLPTIRDAVELVRACPHLRLVADRYPMGDGH